MSTAGVTAKNMGLAGCRICGQVGYARDHECRRCNAPLHVRQPHSLQRVWAWWLAGMLLYIPANLYPMLVTRTLGVAEKNTIVGGVIVLFDHGAYAVAAIVGFASVMIPVAKFVVIGLVAAHASRWIRLDGHTAHRLHHVVEFIGRWSMIDVFVVAIVSTLVQLGFLASIEPGSAAAFFALSVTFTMLSAQALDPRLIWDALEGETTHER